MNKPTLFYQYNPELKETSYVINYIYSSKKMKNIPIPSKPDLDNKIIYSVKYEQHQNFNTPGLFIILVDQSGSMDGKSIELVKKSLISFIEILPKGSYFHLIGFWTNFKIKENLSRYVDDVCSEIRRDNPYFVKNNKYPADIRQNIIAETGWDDFMPEISTNLTNNLPQIQGSKKGANRYRQNRK